MNDRRLDELIRMAREVNELERSAEGIPALRLVGDPVATRKGRSVRRIWIGALSAAAAIAVVGVSVWMAVAPGATHPTQTGTPTAGAHGTNAPGNSPNESPRTFVKHTPLGPTLPVPGSTGTTVRATMPVPVPGSQDESVVLAIYRDNTGGVHCVQMAAHTWANRCLPDVQASELRNVSFGEPCMSEPRQTLLVALAGPRRSLPTSEAGAVALAKCIFSMPRGCDTDAACFSGPASQCIPAGVSVKIESVADQNWEAGELGR